MKFINKKILFAVTALFIIALIPFIQSCSNNNELEGTEKIESSVELTASEKIDIINSKEFTEYTEANIEVASMFQKLDSTSKSKKNIKMGITPDGVKYKTYPFTVDKRLFDNAILKGIALHKKFPTLEKISYIEMKSLARETILKSSSIRQKLITKGLISKRQNVRMKVEPSEGITTYSTAWEAQLYASMYSLVTQNECSGYVFGDGSALLYINPNATHGSTSYPLPIYNQTLAGYDITIYDGKVVQSTIHTQFNSSVFSTPSTTGSTGDDRSVQSISYPNSSLIILYNGGVYEYSFLYGFYIPKP